MYDDIFLLSFHGIPVDGFNHQIAPYIKGSISACIQVITDVQTFTLLRIRLIDAAKAHLWMNYIGECEH